MITLKLLESTYKRSLDTFFQSIQSAFATLNPHPPFIQTHPLQQSPHHTMNNRPMILPRLCVGKWTGENRGSESNTRYYMCGAERLTASRTVLWLVRPASWGLDLPVLRHRLLDFVQYTMLYLYAEMGSPLGLCLYKRSHSHLFSPPEPPLYHELAATVLHHHPPLHVWTQPR